MHETSPPIPVLFEDQHLLVINKPAGLFSQAAAGIASVETVLCDQLRTRDNHSGNPFVGLPHRLDRSTSGIMLIAKNQRVLSRFGAQFQSRKIGKYYLACLDGQLPDEDAHWQDSIRKVEGQPLAEIVPDDHAEGRKASLRLRVLAYGGGRTLVQVELQTGRMHQIRIQAASRGFPVHGDPIYGQGLLTQPSQYPSSEPIALHALRIEFRHPKTAKLTICTAPPPAAWQTYALLLQQELDAVVTRSQHDQLSWNA